MMIVQELISDRVLTNELRCKRYLKKDRLLNAFEWSISECVDHHALASFCFDPHFHGCKHRIVAHLNLRFKWDKQPNYDQCDLPRIMHLLTQLCSHLDPKFFRKLAKPELIYLVSFNLTRVIEASKNSCEEWSRCNSFKAHTRGDHQRARAQVILLRMFAFSEEEFFAYDSFEG